MANTMPEFWIDVGGTFTDCIARTDDGTLVAHKLLSSGVYRGRVHAGSTRDTIVDPARRRDPADFFRGFRLTLIAATAADRSCDRQSRTVLDRDVPIRRFEADSGRLHTQRPLSISPEPGMIYELSCTEPTPIVGIRWLLGKPLDEPIGSIDVRLGTTRGTNALLQRNGAATAFVTTAEVSDLLVIGDQTRPRLFDLRIRKPVPLYRSVVALNERIDAEGRVLQPLNLDELQAKLKAAKRDGIAALAICLANSYRNPAHEERIFETACELGFKHVSVSSRLSPLQGLLARAETTVVDAYLTPVIREYVERIQSRLPEGALKLMTSAGGLADADDFIAKDSILSGPAGGVVGCAEIARRTRIQKVIGFDMGGTSTDVSRFDGSFERRYKMELEDRDTGSAVRIIAPMLAIETVAAGGGSICDFDGIKPVVGPRSAGADPGPACYGRGGPLCLTDVNFFLGRIDQSNFPFPLSRSAVELRLDELLRRIESATGRQYGPEELALGYVAIANAHMVAGIRKVSIQRGYDPREYALICFGGAAGQHACAIARELAIPKIILPAHAGVLSAYGIGMAAVSRFASRDVGRPLREDALADLDQWFAEAETKLGKRLQRQGSAEHQLTETKRLLDLRYAGQDTTLTVERPDDDRWREAFEEEYLRLYGFIFADRPVEIHAARIEVSKRTPDAVSTAAKEPPVTTGHKRSAATFFDDAFLDTPIHDRQSLAPGSKLDGPAIVLDATNTLLVEPHWSAEVNDHGDIVLADRRHTPDDSTRKAPLVKRKKTPADTQCDPIALELFNNRFADIADQMGTTLQRTAISTNVKDRRDFSCGIYGPGGELVAHAPHIPVHLGAMGQCVECLVEDLARRPDEPAMRPGEVYVSNDPYRGGSHLPDVTVVTPVFDPAGERILFFTASRAHHAEIGGITPGSMPSQSRNLADEGVLIRAMRLVALEETAPHESGKFTLRDQQLRRILGEGPYPSRDIDQNVADIHAQAAANQCGVRLLRSAVAQFGLDAVQQYMEHIRDAAETKMRAALRKLRDGVHAFVDYLDDGSPIAVKIIVRGDEATVDFTGTGEVHSGNLNATPAIVGSAVLYCFRCLIDEDMPMNSGVLAPIRIVLPSCFLNPPSHADPERCPAVAGGNVETSQRIVDAIFGALGAAAASQGTMNNITFGSDRFGYYETIGGGAGAAPGARGADCVHTHMTNTRLTDPEVLEARFPVRLRRFAVRRGSGGRGEWPGGDGIIRQLEFLEPLEVSLLTQRRTRAPYGLAGGQPGKAGRNAIRRTAGHTPRDSEVEEELPPICHLRVEPGDILTIETPGGGGYGPPTSNS